jgi:hypothetical protein
MSRISVDRKKAKLNALWGIRARLVLLALILVGPLTLERIRDHRVIPYERETL